MINLMKRRILLIALFLLIGAVLNIAIAHYCAVANSPSIVTLNTYYPSAIVQSVGFGTGHYWNTFGGLGLNVLPKYINRAEDLTLHHRMQRDEENKTYWLDESDNRIYSGNVGHSLFVPLYNKLHAQGNGAQMQLRFNAGAPFSILTGKIEYVPLPGNPPPLWKNTLYDLKVTSWRYGADPGTRFVPTRYMWSGLIAGTVFWGMASALAFYIARPAAKFTSFILCRERGLYWERRNRCHGCGYPIGQSSVCTECGETLRKLKSN